MNGVQTRFKCKLDVKRCKRFVFPPSSLLPRSNALKTKAIRYFQTDRTLTRIVSPPLQKTYNPLDVVFRLANETSLVLLNGGGFAGPKWSVRVSLANLNEADYVKIGQSIKRVLDEYAENR